MVHTILSNSEAVQTGTDQKTALSTNSPHECVEEPQKKNKIGEP